MKAGAMRRLFCFAERVDASLASRAIVSSMRPRDTTEKAAAVVAELNRALGPERRFLQALELSDTLRELAKAGLRSRRPELTEEELLRALTIQMHGDPYRK